jgi:hypothetical protein
MPEINLVDADLKNYYDTAEISIQVNMNGFSFCINSTEDNRIHAFRQYSFRQVLLQEDLLNNISDVLYKDDLLRLHYKKVRVIYTGRKSTLVPDEFFSTDRLKSILEFNQPIDDLDEIHYNAIAGCGSQLAFAIPTYFAGLITDKFPGADFYSQASPLLVYSLSGKEQTITDSVIVQLNKDFFDIVVLCENRLKLYNTFLYADAADLLYFILYVCRQLKIDTKQTTFYFTGEYSSESALIREIRPYIPLIEPIRKPDYLQQSTVLKKLDQDRFFSVLYLMMCA